MTLAFWCCEWVTARVRVSVRLNFFLDRVWDRVRVKVGTFAFVRSRAAATLHMMMQAMRTQYANPDADLSASPDADPDRNADPKTNPSATLTTSCAPQ